MALNRADFRTVTGNSGELAGEPTRVEKGQILHNRWIDAGFSSLHDLAKKSPFDYKTLRKVEAGTASDTIYERLDAWIDEYVNEPPAQPISIEQIEFTVEGSFGVKVTVKGPIKDREALESSVAAIIRSIREPG